MATDKKKVVVYCDWIETFESLTDDEAGRLIKHFFRYVNDLNPTSDRLTELMFTPIKQTLKRDLQSWNEKRSKNSENGKLGGRPKKSEENPTKANGLFENPTKAKKAVSDSVSVSVNDTIPSKDEFIAYGLSKLDDVSIEALGLKYEAWLSNNWSTNKNGKETKIKNWKTTLNNTLTYLPKQPKQIERQKTPDELYAESVMKQMELNKTR